LPGKTTLAAIASGKPNYMATIHMSKGAPKSTRLDAAAVRKRASAKGDFVAEVKPGEMVTSVNVGWTVERFVKTKAEEKPKKAESGKKAKPAKPAPKAKPKKVESGKKAKAVKKPAGKSKSKKK
jgi:hypothetical protein